MVVHAFRRQAVMAIAFDLVAERADHLAVAAIAALADIDVAPRQFERGIGPHAVDLFDRIVDPEQGRDLRSEEHTSELQSLMRISYAVFCLKKKKTTKHKNNHLPTQHNKTDI